MKTWIILMSSVVGSMNAVAVGESNRDNVRRNIAQGGWQVLYGRNFTEAEWLKIGGNVLFGNFMAAGAAAQEFVVGSVNKIVRNSPGVAANVLRQAVENAFRGGIRRIGNLEIKAGIATYQRWKRIVFHVPDGVEFRGIHSKVKMKKVERRIPLPNWHQPFVAVRVRRGGNFKRAPAKFRVVVNNATRNPIHFSLKRANGAFKAFTVRPGYRWTFDSANPIFSIRFDWNFAAGFQQKLYRLQAGRAFDFKTVNGGIDLFVR